MKVLSALELKDLVGKVEPCITVYAPLTGSWIKDRAALQTLLDTACERARNAFPILSPHFDGISADSVLHDAQMAPNPKGVAVFKSALASGVRFVGRPIEPLIVVADSYHLKPLFTELQLEGKYMAVWLERDRVSVFEGDLIGLERIKDIHSTGSEAPPVSGEFVRTGATALHPVTFKERPALSRADQFRLDRATIRFYKRADNEVRRRIVKSDTPVILVGEERLMTLYRNVNKLRSAVVASIPKVGALGPTHAEVHLKALEVLEEFHRRRALRGVVEFKYTRPYGRAIDNLHAIAEAAAKGQIKALLIRSGSQVWGRLNRKTGRMVVSETIGENVTDDLLDDIGEMVLKNNGQVYVLKPNEMPTSEPLAAVLGPRIAV